MAIAFADRVRETSTTTGTGTFDLDGAVVSFQGFVAGVGTGAEVHYSITDGVDWEVGEGVVTDASPDTLVRSIVLSSSNSGALVNFAAGAKDVFLTMPTDLAASIKRTNIIIGGNFDTNPWQREVTFAAIATDTFCADRFRYEKVGAGIATAQKTADAPTLAESGIVVANCLEFDVTTIDSSVAAGDFQEVRYSVEGYDWAQIAQKPFVLAFWHNHTKTGTYCVSLRNSGDDRSYVAEYTQTTTNTWEESVVRITASPSAGTWNYTNGRGVTIAFSMMAGTTFHTTADAWNTGAFKSTSSQVNAFDSASNFCRFDLIRCVSGVVTPEVEVELSADILDRVQRYYEHSYTVGVYPAATSDLGEVNGTRYQATATVVAGAYCKFKVSKASAPTVVSYNPTDGTSGELEVGLGGRSSTVIDIGTDGCQIDTSAANFQVVGDRIRVHFTAESEIF